MVSGLLVHGFDYAAGRGSVLPDQAAEDGPALDPLPGEAGDGVIGPGRAQVAAAVGSSSVAVGRVLGQDRVQMPPAEDQHPVSDLLSGDEHHTVRRRRSREDFGGGIAAFGDQSAVIAGVASWRLGAAWPVVTAGDFGTSPGWPAGGCQGLAVSGLARRSASARMLAKEERTAASHTAATRPAHHWPAAAKSVPSSPE
jgi:hypothetical protein